MKTHLYLLICILVGLYSCSNGQAQNNAMESASDSIVKIEMYLSAFGVESDDFPSIDAKLNFTNDTSICTKSFYNPAYTGSTYTLTESEMRAIKTLLKISDLEQLKKEYSVNISDQARSTTKIYTTKKIVVIDDYGLRGDYPLQDLYKIVYRY